VEMSAGDETREEAGGPADEAREDIGSDLLSGLGILRNAESIRSALERLENRPDTETVRLGRAMLLSALAREESRGAHTRTDFPERDDERFGKTTVTAYRQGEIVVEFRDIPGRREI